jgi:hypothetical protein
VQAAQTELTHIALEGRLVTSLTLVSMTPLILRTHLRKTNQNRVLPLPWSQAAPTATRDAVPGGVHRLAVHR